MRGAKEQEWGGCRLESIQQTIFWVINAWTVLIPPIDDESLKLIP